MKYFDEQVIPCGLVETDNLGFDDLLARGNAIYVFDMERGEPAAYFALGPFQAFSAPANALQRSALGKCLFEGACLPADLQPLWSLAQTM